MTADNIRHLGWTYRRQGVAIVAGLFLVGLLAANIVLNDSIVMPLVISVIYALVLEVGDAWVWTRMAIRTPDNMPNFFLGASLVRVVAAILAMLVYYLMPNRGEMWLFLAVFAVFYLAIMTHHVLFFRKHSDLSTDK